MRPDPRPDLDNANVGKTRTQRGYVIGIAAFLSLESRLNYRRPYRLAMLATSPVLTGEADYRIPKPPPPKRGRGTMRSMVEGAF